MSEKGLHVAKVDAGSGGAFGAPAAGAAGAFGAPAAGAAGAPAAAAADYWSAAAVGAPAQHMAAAIKAAVANAGATPGGDSFAGAGGMSDEREVKRQRRKQSNRESARRSRLRKQAECEELGTRVDLLTNENMQLREEVTRLHEACSKLEEKYGVLRGSFKELTGKEVDDVLVGKAGAKAGKGGKASDAHTKAAAAAAAAIAAAHDAAVKMTKTNKKDDSAGTKSDVKSDSSSGS